MRILVYEPGKEPELREIDGDALASMQEIVGGYIEAVPMFHDRPLCVICNENGRLLGLPPNIAGFVGTFFIARQQHDHFVSLTADDLAYLAIDFPAKTPPKAKVGEVESKWKKVKLIE